MAAAHFSLTVGSTAAVDRLRVARTIRTNADRLSRPRQSFSNAFPGLSRVSRTTSNPWCRARGTIYALNKTIYGHYCFLYSFILFHFFFFIIIPVQCVVFRFWIYALESRSPRPYDNRYVSSSVCY